MKVPTNDVQPPVAKPEPVKSFAELLKVRTPMPRSAKPAAKTAVKPAAKAGAKTVSPRTGSASGTRGGSQQPGMRPSVLMRPLRGIRASTAQAARQIDASKRGERVLRDAHSQSAETSQDRQGERQGDQVRAQLFQAIERECSGGAGLPSEPNPDDPHGEPRPSSESVRSAEGGSATSAPASASASSPQRAQAIAELVERIEVALKSGQPTLSLGLASRSGAASVEIRRTGKGEVALRISARAGSRQALAASGEQLKGDLQARGLRVKSLQIC
jgi:hypothetical protein